MNRVWLGILASVAMMGGLPSVVHAQSVPSSAEPGHLEQRFDAPPVPQSTVPIAIPEPSQVAPPEQAAKIRFVLKDIVFEGVTAYDTLTLREVATPLQGREISLLDLYALRDELTRKYRADGYVLSQVVLPAQKIADGVVKFRVIEGYVAEVRFEGDAFDDHAGLLAAFAEKIKASKPLRLADLERYVLLADDLAGLEAKTVIKPADTLGGAVLTFVLTRKPVSASMTADNRGTRAIGPYQLDGAVEVSDQTGLFESTRLRVIGTPEFQELLYIDLAETVPLNSEGTTLSLGARRSWSEPGADVAQFDLNSRSLTLRAAVTHPIIRLRSETLRASVALTAREYDTQALGQPLSRDHLRVISAGLSYDVADALGGLNLISATLHRGLPILGASDKSDTNLSRGGASGDFYKITASAQRLQPLFDAVSLFVAVDGQYSPFKLLSSEEYGLGGAYFGSAFDYSELTGDSALAGRIELQYSPDLGVPELRLSQIYLFTDGGGVWNYEDDIRYGWQTLWSAGVGLRFAVTDNLAASLEAARPVSSVPSATGDKDWRGFFSITLRY